MKNEKYQNLKIAIRFGDNDFGNTFLGVLRLLFDAFKHSGGLPVDKDKLCFIINNLSPIAYVTYQNQWEYNGLETADGMFTDNNDEFIHTKKYLQITPEKILLNDEVDKYLKKLGKDQWDNSETFILDTSLYNNNIYFV